MRHAGDNKWIGIMLEAENGEAIIGISDYGDGIGPEELERIWDKYYTKRQRQEKGASGLGLAIVKQTAALHNGKS